MLAVSKGLRILLERFGQALILMPLLLILIEFVIVVSLYFFAGETTQLEESLRYINATMFLGAIGGVLLVDGHVRVDIFYEKASARRKAITDAAGILLFVLPLAGFFAWSSWPFIRLSWLSLEGSTETGGLHIVYILKSLLLLLPITLTLASIIRLIDLVPVAMGKSTGSGQASGDH